MTKEKREWFVNGAILIAILLVCYMGIYKLDSQYQAKQTIEGITMYDEYLVQKGDTIWSIAEEYRNQYSYEGVSNKALVREIQDLNGVYNHIESGKYIIVPVVD